jgi:repressor LexA
MHQPLTKRQHEILEFIESFLHHHDYAPTFRDIATAFNFSSVATVAEHVENLRRKGYLTKDPLAARTLQLVAPEPHATPATAGARHAGLDEQFAGVVDGLGTIRLAGVIAAGSPIEAIETNLTIDIPRDMTGPNVFALRVRGDSMVDDGILDGDYVIVEQTSEPKNGDIVVALLDNSGATLKRFYREKNRIRLQPANANYAPIYADNPTIQGKVRGVIRRFG